MITLKQFFCSHSNMPVVAECPQPFHKENDRDFYIVEQWTQCARCGYARRQFRKKFVGGVEGFLSRK